MEKMGVQIDEDGMKKHSSEGECPSCGGKMNMETNPPKCEKCGTEPFEQGPGTNRDGD